MRVILPGTRISFDLTDDILHDNDPRIIENDEFGDCSLKGLIQLSAKDINGDGKLEIIASIGSWENHVNYIWSFNRKTGPELIKKE